MSGIVGVLLASALAVTPREDEVKSMKDCGVTDDEIAAFRKLMPD